MLCPRCCGCIYLEVIHSGSHAHNPYPLRLLACLNCGNRLDYLIAKHQRDNPKPIPEPSPLALAERLFAKTT